MITAYPARKQARKKGAPDGTPFSNGSCAKVGVATYVGLSQTLCLLRFFINFLALPGRSRR